MNLFNILATISIPGFGNGFGDAKLTYEWICNIIEFIIDHSGDIGLGIILFTLALKLITLPLDIYSKTSMKKNGLKMEKMRPQLEKLQRQYANNKDLYNQKMMALYKKEGYNMMSACLPSLLTIVFFFIVFASFNSYSRFANKDVINQMAVEYTESLESQTEEGYIEKDSENENVYNLNIEEVLNIKGYSDYFTKTTNNAFDTASFNLDFLKLTEESELYTNYKQLQDYYKNGKFNIDNAKIQALINSEAHTFLVNIMSESIDELTEQGIIKDSLVDGQTVYVIKDLEAFYKASSVEVKKYIIETTEKEKKEYKLDYKKIIEENSTLNDKLQEKGEVFLSTEAVTEVSTEFLNEVVYKKARLASKEAYYTYRSKSKIIFWVENIWVSDNPFSSAVQSYSQLSASLANKEENIGSLTEKAYNEIIFELKEETNTGFGKGNGYFVLIILSIITMLGSTFIMQKSQKSQMELQSVGGAEGQTAQTQKMMMWMMPIMFGFFAFMYSSAFSIYMIISSLYSTISTLVINYFVEKKFEKEMERIAQENAQKYNRRGK